MRALGECAKIVPEKYTVHPGTCVHVFFCGRTALYDLQKCKAESTVLNQIVQQ